MPLMAGFMILTVLSTLVFIFPDTRQAAGRGEAWRCRQTFRKTVRRSASSDTPFFADGVWPDTLPCAGETASSTLGGYYFEMNMVMLARHGGKPPYSPAMKSPLNDIPNGINVAFVDGHVKWQKLGDLYNEDIWNVGWFPPNPAQ